MPGNRRLTTELRSVRGSFTALDRALGRLAKSIAGSASPAGHKLTLSPARRAALKLQGRYMGYMRKLKPKQKAQVKAVRETKGIRTAIGMARSMS